MSEIEEKNETIKISPFRIYPKEKKVTLITTMDADGDLITFGVNPHTRKPYISIKQPWFGGPGFPTYVFYMEKLIEIAKNHPGIFKKLD